ncbi:MAG: hypothetical protein Phog2KO_24920 [Phototrophicaceae bacterium]
MNSHDILHNLSEKSDADKSNLWHSIAHQIDEENLMRKSKNRRLRLSTTWAVALIGILLMGSAIFGRNQRKIYHAVTIAEIERMAVPLDLVETNNDLTIQLDWAYADANQIVIAYSAFDMDGEPVLANELAESGRVEVKHLYPNTNTSSLFSFFMPTVISELESTQQVVRFSVMGTYFEALDEFLEQGFDINETGIMDIELRFFHNPPNILYTPSHSFELEIPFGLSTFEQHNGTIDDFEEWHTTEPTDDIEVYFSDFVIADSSTHLFMCMQIPSNAEQTWYLPSEVNLYADNHLIETVSIPYQSYARWADFDDTRIRFDAVYSSNRETMENYCVQFMWQLAFDDLPQTLRVEIPAFRARIIHTADSPISQAYVDLYAEEGYLLEYLYNEEYDHTSLVYPPEFEALSFEERSRIAQNVQEALNDLYPLDARFSQGWEYTIELSPESEE